MSTPPSGRPPQRRRPARTRIVAVVAAAGLLLVALLSALTVAVRQAPSEPSPTAPASWVTPVAGSTSRLVTLSPTPAPSSQTVLSGGSIGAPVEFGFDTGAGKASITRAEWTASGDIAPQAGEQYLVLEVTVTATSGSLAVDTLSFVALGADGSRHQPSFGPALTQPLGGRTLAAGAAATGQVGFALAPQAVGVLIVDATLTERARLELPAP